MLFVACCDPSEMFDPIEETLDTVAVPIECLA